MFRLIIIFAVLLGLSLLSLQQLHALPANENIFVKIGVITILLFSLVVILRYFILLFFSMLNLYKNIRKEETQPLHSDDKPFVSILVPCFNEEKVIKASLESLMNQTYPHYEIILIDDGSTDDTFLMAKNMEFNNSLQF